PFRHAGSLLLIVMGLISFLCWCKAVMPLTQWLRLFWRIKMILLASLVVGAAASTAGWFTDKLWTFSNRGTFWFVMKLLALTGTEFKCEPKDLLIATPSFWLKVPYAASGYNGLGMIWVLFGAYLWVYRRELRFPHALLLLPIGTAVVWLINVLRIALIV